MKHIIFETKEQYLEAIQAWKNTCKENDFQLSAEHYALYAIIRGKDPQKCFATPEQQSARKLKCQGKSGNEAYNYAMSAIKGGYRDAFLLAPFDGKINALQLTKIRNYWQNEHQRQIEEQEEDNLNQQKLLMLGVA